MHRQLAIIAVAAWLGVPGFQFTAADPVITATGDYRYVRTDLNLRGAGSPLIFQRTYSSANGFRTTLGAGWTHNFNVNLVLGFNPTDPVHPHSVLIETPDGREDFDRQSDGSYAPTPGTRSTLAQNKHGTLSLTREDRTVWTFDSAGRLSQITDPLGLVSSLKYDDHSNALASVSDPLGRGSVSFSYDGCHPAYTLEKLCRITDWIGRSYTYAYDDRGRLSTVTDPDGHATIYTYIGDTSLLHTIQDARGHVAMTLEYDDLNRVVSETDARGQLTGSR